MRRSDEVEEDEEEEEEEEDEEEEVSPGLTNQTAEVGQGLVSAPQLCVYQTGVGTGQDELEPRLTYRSDRLNCEIKDWMTQDHGYHNREVRGQWNYQNTVYHGGYDQGLVTEQIRVLTAEQTRVGYNNFEVPNGVGVYPVAGFGCQDRNFGYQDQNVYSNQLQTVVGYCENPGYGRPCYVEQGGIANADYENQMQNNLRWVLNPDRRGEDPPPCTCRPTENHDSAVDLSLHRGYQVNRCGPHNNNTDCNSTDAVDFRLGAQDWNSSDMPLDMSTYRQTLDVVPGRQTQFANSFGNIHGHSGNANGTASSFPTPGWRLDAEDWNSLDIPLDMSMTGPAAMGSWNSAPAAPENLMPYAAAAAAAATGFANLHGAGSTGGDRNTDSSNFETIDWSSLEFPLDMSTNRQATENQIVIVGDDGCHSVEPENQLQRSACNSSAEPSPPGPCSGKAVRKKRSSEKTEGFERYVRPKRCRRRRKSLLLPEDAPIPQPKTKAEQRQQQLEDALLANYRPILPKPREVGSPEPLPPEKASDDGPNAPEEMRKRWRGWKCCEETFDDYNVYQDHVQTAHAKTDTPSKPVKKRSVKSTVRKKPASASTTSSKSKAVLCPFCLTNHEMLGTDIATTQSWTGSDFLLCPLCQRKYKTLRQLKIHFCLHFQVKVSSKVSEGEKPTCRFCKRSFVRFVTLREHETDCAAKQKDATEQNSQVKSQSIGSTAEVVASPAASAASTAASASAASSSTASSSTAAARPSTAKTPSASTKRASMVAASSRTRASSAAMTTESTAAAAAATMSASAETPPPSVAAPASNSSDERLFYCPDCGKLFTWEGSVRRHQQRTHAKAPDQCHRKKGRSHQQQPEVNRTETQQQQPEQLDQGEPLQHHHHHQQQQHQHQSTAASPANPVVTWSNEDLLDELLIDEQIN